MDVKGFADHVAAELGKRYKEYQSAITGEQHYQPDYASYRQFVGQCLALREADAIVRKAYRDWMKEPEDNDEGKITRRRQG